VFDHLFDQGQAPNSLPKKNQPDQGDFDLKLISKQGSFKSVLKALKKRANICSYFNILQYMVVDSTLTTFMKSLQSVAPYLFTYF